MVKNFYSDLEASKGAEEAVMRTFAALAPNYAFVDISNDRIFFHKGDILALAPDYSYAYIEVKQDGCIARTHNVLCEEAVYYFSNGEKVRGNMYSDYQYYCVVSPAENKIYVIDFAIMHEHYKSGYYKEIPHEDQITYAYLMPLYRLQELGAIIAVVDII